MPGEEGWKEILGQQGQLLRPVACTLTGLPPPLSPLSLHVPAPSTFRSQWKRIPFSYFLSAQLKQAVISRRKFS